MVPRKNSHVIVASILFTFILDDLHRVIGRINGEAMLKDAGYKRRKVVKIGLILPTNSSYPWSLQRTMPAVEYAIETARNQLKLLPSYNLEVSFNDSRCSDIMAPLAAFNMYVNSRANVFIGPCCDYAMAPIARFSPVWGIPVISAGAHIDAFKNKDEYKLLTRIQGTYEKYGQFFFSIARYFNWTNMGMIYNDNINDPNMGRSNCYFQIQPIYQLLITHYQHEVWHVVIDERDTKINLRKILLDAALYTRSEY